MKDYGPRIRRLVLVNMLFMFAIVVVVAITWRTTPVLTMVACGISSSWSYCAAKQQQTIDILRGGSRAVRGD